MVLATAGCRHSPASAIATGERSPRTNQITSGSEVAGGLRSAVVSLYAEADRTATETVAWELPMSGVAIACSAGPLVEGSGFVHVAVAPLELGTAVEIQLGAAARHAVQDFVKVPDPGRLVLVFDGKAFGAARVRSLDATGRITLFVELPENRLPEFVSQMQAAVTRTR